MSEEFQSPVGLRRWCTDSEIPPQEGYDLALLEDCENAYRLTAVASTEKIPQLARSFSRFFPGEAFCILEYYPDPDVLTSTCRDSADKRPAPEVYYSPYLPVEEILQVLDPYWDRLIHDGFVGFGLANNRAGLEMFYSEEKVLTFFTDNHLRLCDFLTGKGIPYNSDLSLPTDYGHDHVALLGLPRKELPPSLVGLCDSDLDSLNFCHELVEQLDMYPVEEGLSFFLTRKEQAQVADILEQNLFEDLAGTEFGGLLLDWSDFVSECENGFDGDLEEYRQALKIRDCIQFVIEAAPPELARKIEKIVAEPDSGFRDILTDRRKRLDPPSLPDLREECFWYHGVVRNQGTVLRRDLIRKGWFSS
ncbi:MAG: hypothetical protein RQ754_14115 [Desulfuromonadales bacterium]|nr:hypothetical protein [Desulfuromonadales bacterium]